MIPRPNFWRHQDGASAAEFVLVLTPLIMLVIGTINLGMMLYTSSALHFAVEDAARCATVRAASTCASKTLIEAYAASHYGGPGTAPSFAWSTSGCGNIVIGTVNYNFTTGLTNTTIPMKAKACYPLS